jgi:DNA-binding transcriptional regulator YiaG
METNQKSKLFGAIATRPTVSIKKHLAEQKQEQEQKKSTAAIRGVLKNGNAYKFTKYKHEEIIAMLEKVRQKTPFSHKNFSVALGFGSSTYSNWVVGSRFSRKSYIQVMQKAAEINEQCNKQGQLSLGVEKPTYGVITLEAAIQMVKDAGYKVYKRIENWEEI